MRLSDTACFERNTYSLVCIPMPTLEDLWAPAELPRAPGTRCGATALGLPWLKEQATLGAHLRTRSGKHLFTCG